MHEVEELCDRIAFMSCGKIVSTDTSANLKKLIKNHTVEIAVKKNIGLLRSFLKKEGIEILFAEENSIIFEVTTDDDKIYKIISKIFHQGFLLSKLHIKGPTLDDIFIKIARQR